MSKRESPCSMASENSTKLTTAEESAEKVFIETYRDLATLLTSLPSSESIITTENSTEEASLELAIMSTGSISSGSLAISDVAAKELSGNTASVQTNVETANSSLRKSMALCDQLTEGLHKLGTHVRDAIKQLQKMTSKYNSLAKLVQQERDLAAAKHDQLIEKHAAECKLAEERFQSLQAQAESQIIDINKKVEDDERKHADEVNNLQMEIQKYDRIVKQERDLAAAKHDELIEKHAAECKLAEERFQSLQAQAESQIIAINKKVEDDERKHADEVNNLQMEIQKYDRIVKQERDLADKLIKEYAEKCSLAEEKFQSLQAQVGSQKKVKDNEQKLTDEVKNLKMEIQILKSTKEEYAQQLEMQEEQLSKQRDNLKAKREVHWTIKFLLILLALVAVCLESYVMAMEVSNPELTKETKLQKKIVCIILLIIGFVDMCAQYVIKKKISRLSLYAVFLCAWNVFKCSEAWYVLEASDPTSRVNPFGPLLAGIVLMKHMDSFGFMN